MRLRRGQSSSTPPAPVRPRRSSPARRSRASRRRCRCCPPVSSETTAVARSRPRRPCQRRRRPPGAPRSNVGSPCRAPSQNTRLGQSVSPARRRPRLKARALPPRAPTHRACPPRREGRAHHHRSRHPRCRRRLRGIRRRYESLRWQPRRACAAWTAPQRAAAGCDPHERPGHECGLWSRSPPQSALSRTPTYSPRRLRRCSFPLRSSLAGVRVPCCAGRALRLGEVASPALAAHFCPQLHPSRLRHRRLQPGVQRRLCARVWAWAWPSAAAVRAACRRRWRRLPPRRARLLCFPRPSHPHHLRRRCYRRHR